MGPSIWYIFSFILLEKERTKTKKKKSFDILSVKLCGATADDGYQNFCNKEWERERESSLYARDAADAGPAVWLLFDSLSQSREKEKKRKILFLVRKEDDETISISYLLAITITNRRVIYNALRRAGMSGRGQQQIHL